MIISEHEISTAIYTCSYRIQSTKTGSGWVGGRGRTGVRGLHILETLTSTSLLSHDDQNYTALHIFVKFIERQNKQRDSDEYRIHYNTVKI